MRRNTALVVLLVLCSGLALAQSAPDALEPRAPQSQVALNLESLRKPTYSDRSLEEPPHAIDMPEPGELRDLDESGMQSRSQAVHITL